MMRVPRLFGLGLIAALLLPSATAADVRLTIADGRVTLVATNATIPQILAEWTRVGGTVFVNGEHMKEGPVTLELVDTPERTALEVLLRSASGYILAPRVPAPRATRGASDSLYERVLVMPTSVAPAAATQERTMAVAARGRAAAPVPDPVVQRVEETVDDIESDPGGLDSVAEGYPAAAQAAPPSAPDYRETAGLPPGVPIGGPLTNPSVIPERFRGYPTAGAPTGTVAAPITSSQPGTVVAPQLRQLRPGESFSRVVVPPSTPPASPPADTAEPVN